MKRAIVKKNNFVCHEIVLVYVEVRMIRTNRQFREKNADICLSANFQEAFLTKHYSVRLPCVVNRNCILCLINDRIVAVFFA